MSVHEQLEQWLDESGDWEDEHGRECARLATQYAELVHDGAPWWLRMPDLSRHQPGRTPDLSLRVDVYRRPWWRGGGYVAVVARPGQSTTMHRRTKRAALTSAVRVTAHWYGWDAAERLWARVVDHLQHPPA